MKTAVLLALLVVWATATIYVLNWNVVLQRENAELRGDLAMARFAARRIVP